MHTEQLALPDLEESLLLRCSACKQCTWVEATGCSGAGRASDAGALHHSAKWLAFDFCLSRPRVHHGLHIATYPFGF